ncbi:MAG TPA: molybdenum cofactor guanylyltransferase [Blastocatellia bacterium]|nr:molybdenum cofactor guanylyltransferase [Blastocatellia bacterium]
MGKITPSTVRGFIQAGGRSSRMGQDKAWLEVKGRRLIERVLAAAQPVVTDLAVIINAANPRAEDYRLLAADWNARLIYDLQDHRGPLGGIQTALKHCLPHQSALILACDLPFLTSELLSRLRQIHGGSNLQSLISDPPLTPALIPEVTVPVDREGRWQPLAAIYAASCLPAVEQMLAEDLLKIEPLYQRVRTRQVRFPEIGDLPRADQFFLNLNTLDDYAPLRN